MRAYQITRKAIKNTAKEDDADNSQPEAKRFGGSQSEASTHKRALLEEAGLRPQADADKVTIEQIEIPTGKADLIPFLNKLVG